MTPQDKEAIERAAYLLGTVRQFIDTNPISEYSVYYDEAICDGACLRDDCLTAELELDRMLSAKGGTNAQR